MPTLQFKGKNIIWNHHLSIPYHTLDEVEKLHFQPGKADGNLIIEGDNLLALKALLPQYAGKVKCIYIDPPYNTGNEGWVYNDNVNSPMLKDWLGKEVGKDDLTRHDKWLCMMVPRLKLLRELLADDGAIFISIDDNEQHILRMVMDEILGEENFVANVIWQKAYSPKMDAMGFSSNHDHIICYSKSENIYPIRETVNQDKSQFNYFDEVKQLFYRRRSIRKEGMNSLKTDAPSAFFALFSPDNEEVYPIKPNGIESCWRWSKETYLEELSKGNVEWIKKDDKWEVYAKQYFADISERSPLTVWLHNEVGHNHSASEELSKIIGARIFDSPKPIALLKKILKIATTQHSLILDSFAGSGTTMHAVMDLNKEDGGNRKCILIQMAEATEAEPKKNICKDITRERVKRAIDKYGYDSGFQYFKVGIPIDAETLLSGNLPTFKQFADYVYYLCTGESLKNKSAANEKSYFVGEYGNSIIYLVYKQDFDELTRMALNLSLAEKITAEHPKKKIIVYAPACFLEENYMKEKNIDYVGIPYNLFRRT